MNTLIDRISERPERRSQRSLLLGGLPRGTKELKPEQVGWVGQAGDMIVEDERPSANGKGGREGPVKGDKERAARRSVVSVAPVTSGGGRSAGPSEDIIRRRAFFIYIARAGPPGDALGDWLQAEVELRDEFTRRTSD